MRPLPFWLPRREVRAWNPSLHPRGPNGRFTKSFAKLAGGGDKKRIATARKGFKARPPFRSPDDAAGWLSGMSGQKSQPDMLAQLRQANQSLRSGKPDQSGFEKLLKPTTEDVTVFRSVPATKFGTASPKDLEGFLVKDAGYFPTALAPTSQQPGEVRMTIDVPAGTKAAASSDTSELVLDAGLEMSVDEVTTTPDGSAEMHLTALGAADDSAPDSPATPGADTAGSVDQRLSAAATGPAARRAVPASLLRDSDLPAEHVEALRAYAGDQAYRSINSVLRGASDEELANLPLAGDTNNRESVAGWVSNMDAAMDSSRLTQDAVGYRGIGQAGRIFGDRVNGDLTGMEWREDSYTSTTTDPEISEDFAGNIPPGAVVMRMLMPAGVGGIELSDESHESEVLLQRGLTMRVVADNGVDEDGVRRIDVEVVPADAT